jgi:hypothetical protein
MSKHDVFTKGTDTQAALRRAIRGVIRSKQPLAGKEAVRNQLRSTLSTIGRHYDVQPVGESLSDLQQLYTRLEKISPEEAEYIQPGCLQKFKDDNNLENPNKTFQFAVSLENDSDFGLEELQLFVFQGPIGNITPTSIKAPVWVEFWKVPTAWRKYGLVAADPHWEFFEQHNSEDENEPPV